jgi:hypothetical protein
MAEPTSDKPTWETPAVEALTETDSRADVHDVGIQNIVSTPV